MLAEPVPKPTSGFANVRQSACPTSYDIHEVTCRASEPLLYGQRSTGGVDLGGWVGMGTGLASWPTAAKSSIWFILSVCAGLKVAADQGITQVGVAAVRVEYSRVIKQFLSFRPGSDFKRSKFLDRMFFTWWLMGLYVKIKGMTSLLDCPSLGGRKAVSRGIVSTC